MDDTFVILRISEKERFPEHINSMDLYIKFTVEETTADGSTPFLDTLVIPEPDNSLSTTVYRKPTHIDLYLQWDSHPNLAAEFSVINTLTHRPKTLLSDAAHSCSRGNNNTSNKHCYHASTPSGPSTEPTSNTTSPAGSLKVPITSGTIYNTITTRSFTKWYLTLKG